MSARATFAILATCVIVACATKPPPPPPPPPPPKATLVVATHSDVNPDLSGRASPVVVRVYQLKSDSAFAGAGFFSLFDDERKVLGAELIARDEYELVPGERRTLEFAPPPDMRFLGALAAFHDVRNSTWRTLLTVPKSGLGNTRVEVVADKTTIRIELGH
jgi:type VI secretion system protein VasD